MPKTIHRDNKKITLLSESQPLARDDGTVALISSRAPVSPAGSIPTLIEKWNTKIVRQITKLADITPELYNKLTSLLSSKSRPYICKGILSQTYKLKAGCKRKWGRLYSNGLQSINGWARRLISHEYYYDIDMQNCHFTLLLHICKQLNFPHHYIAEYVENREHWLSFGDPKLMKMAFLVLCNETRFAQCPSEDSVFVSFWDSLCAELTTVTELCLGNSDLFYEEKMAATEEKDPDVDHKKKTFALILQKKESEVLLCMLKFFQENNITVGTLVFDGLMIEKGNITPRGLNRWLRKCEAFVLLHTKIQITLVSKSLEPTESDLLRLDGKLDQTIMTPFTSMTYLLSEYGNSNTYARMEDALYKVHPDIPGVYLPVQGNAEYHINEILKDDPIFDENAFLLSKLVEWWNKKQHKNFRLITADNIDHNIIAFKNGYFSIDTLKLYNLGEYVTTFERQPLTFFFHNVDYSANLINAPTPNWNKLLTAQWKPEVCQFFEHCVGRLFYKIKTHDDWQIMPYLIGDANTGKSTIVETIQKLFPFMYVGVISANQELVFGLEGVSSKRLIVIPDAPREMSKVLAPSLFQSMVSGEMANISRKHKQPLSKIWETPIIASGNFFFDYVDLGGRFSRRCMAFPMYNAIKVVDGMLSKNIISELPTIMLRSIFGYRAFAAVTTAKIWDAVPQQLRDMQEVTKQDTNRLYKFLRQGNDYYTFDFDENAFTTFKDFTDAYKKHCKFNLQEAYKHSDLDNSLSFRDCKFDITTIRVCKSCRGKSQSSCCSSYDVNNRSIVKVIAHMKMNVLNVIKIEGEDSEVHRHSKRDVL